MLNVLSTEKKAIFNMLKCPYCDGVDFTVIDVRNSEKVNGIRRRRECQSCGKRFTTYEICSNMYQEDPNDTSNNKFSDPGPNFKQLRRDSIKIARDLCYDKYIIKELENAKNETQISQIMAKGRNRRRE